MKKENNISKKISWDKNRNFRFKEFFEKKKINQEDFSNRSGMPQSNLSAILNNKRALGEKTIDKYIVPVFPELNKIWLLTGEGEMQNLPVATHTESQSEGIPLIPLEAMAGVGSGELSVLELDCERYVIPMFKGADYLIPVKGSSMYPKYNSGDVVACKKLALQDVFFQWNKVYVLDTEQGALIKRVCKGSDNEHITLVSDNEKYEPFELHKSQIYAVALVVGVVRLE